MKTSSAKSKGRRLQQHVRDVLLENFSTLEPDDVRSTGMGQSGVDIQLSPAAQSLIPLAIECKNQESISIWQCLSQAEKNSNDKLKPALVFKRNHSDVYVCLKFNDFISLMKKE